MEIRPVELEDADAIAAIRREDGVREGVMSLSGERTDATVNFLRSLSGKDRGFVAVEDGKIIGFAVLLSEKDPSREHCASIAVMVGKNSQKRGVGRALLARLTDCADNELELHRLELLVLTDNEKAVKLYKSAGFTVEATKKHAAVVRGAFVDEYLMGRLHSKEAAI